MEQKEEEDETAKRKEVDLDLSYVLSRKELYDKLVGKYPPDFGRALSHRERDKKELSAPHLAYSEISFDALAISFQKIIKIYGKESNHGPMPLKGSKFCDLGSGVGKTLVAASLMHNFSSCHGIEMLESLHNASEWILDHYRSKVNQIVENEHPPEMTTSQGDFLDLDLFDWRGVDVLFVNATCFGLDMLTQLMKLAAGLRKGAFVISVSFAIPGKDFHLFEYSEQSMNWGPANVFIQQKITDSYEYIEEVVEEDEEEENDLSGQEVEEMDEEEVEMTKKVLSGLFA